MLKLPDNLTAQSFLEQYWQKRAVFMPGALPSVRPAVTRNELGWLATLDDVESRLVFIDRTSGSARYRVENGPFAADDLAELPTRDWTLLVHDVEKHVPAMRALFRIVPFIPDWRIDDLMVSFAAPGGGVGPHRDNYDVFLCQGIGERHWHFSADSPPQDPAASDDLQLVEEFAGSEVNAVQGDILYLPPGIAHWGTAKRACITYSIGMRAPEASDLAYALGMPTPDTESFYRDPDLDVLEAIPGTISQTATERAMKLLRLGRERREEVAIALGQFATRNKDWLKPDGAGSDELNTWLDHLLSGGKLDVHGMAQIAFDERNLFVNGSHFPLPAAAVELVQSICRDRRLARSVPRAPSHGALLAFLLAHGAFEIPENTRPYVK